MFVLLATLVLCLPAVIGQSTCQCNFPNQLTGHINLKYDFRFESSKFTAFAHFTVDYSSSRVHLVPQLAYGGNVSQSIIDMDKGKAYVWLKKGGCSIIDVDHVAFPRCVPLANTTITSDSPSIKRFVQTTTDGYYLMGTFRRLPNNTCLPMDLKRFPQDFKDIRDLRRWFFENLRGDLENQHTSRSFPKTDNCVETRSFNFLMY